jgi:hypothetical protein
MARALTPGKKVCTFLDIQQPPAFFSALPVEQQGRVMEWLCAEAYAAGCYHALHYRFSDWEGPREALGRCGRFFGENHDRYYAGTHPEARIGVLYSLASYVWDMYPTRWTGEGRAHCREYTGVCQALLDANLQFDTVLLGDGRFVAQDRPEGLNEFDILIAPSAYSLSEGNLSALAEYVMAGGHLLRCGPFGILDGSRQPRRVLPPELAAGHGGVYELGVSFESHPIEKNPESRLALAAMLVGTLGHEPLVALRDPTVNLQVTGRRSPARKALLLDILNRDYAPRRGFRPAGETDLLLTLPSDFGVRGKTVRVLSPDPGGPSGEVEWHPVSFARRTAVREGLPGPMSISGRHTISLRLPPTDVYNLVVIE